MSVDRRFPEQRDLDVQHCESLVRLESHIKAEKLPDLCPRKWSDPDADGGNASITVMQSNILAEGLSAPPKEVRAPPFAAQKDSTYGYFEGVSDPSRVFEWRHRKFQVLREILQSRPDVVALEEVDHFHDFFEPAMRKFGYAGKFEVKGHSPCLDFGYYSDGVAVFWKTEQFRLISDHSDRFRLADGGISDRPYVLLRLEHISTGFHVAVAGVHLKAKAIQENEDVRAETIQQLLVKTRQVYDDGAPYVVMLGDFNTNPHSTGNVKAICVPEVQKSQLPALHSAYPWTEGAWTTWKVRKGIEVKHITDYIFYSDSLQCCSILNPPEATLIPGLHYPSDHIALAAVLKFKFKGVPMPLSRELHYETPPGCKDPEDISLHFDILDDLTENLNREMRSLRRGDPDPGGVFFKAYASPKLHSLSHASLISMSPLSNVSDIAIAYGRAPTPQQKATGCCQRQAMESKEQKDHASMPSPKDSDSVQTLQSTDSFRWMPSRKDSDSLQISDSFRSMGSRKDSVPTLQRTDSCRSGLSSPSRRAQPQIRQVVPLEQLSHEELVHRLKQSMTREHRLQANVRLLENKVKDIGNEVQAATENCANDACQKLKMHFKGDDSVKALKHRAILEHYLGSKRQGPGWKEEYTSG